MPDDLRHLDPVIHRTVGDMEIRTADATVGDVQANLTVARRTNLAPTHGKPVGALVIDSRQDEPPFLVG